MIKYLPIKTLHYQVTWKVTLSRKFLNEFQTSNFNDFFSTKTEKYKNDNDTVNGEISHEITPNFIAIVNVKNEEHKRKETVTPTVNVSMAKKDAFGWKLSKF